MSVDFYDRDGEPIDQSDYLALMQDPTYKRVAETAVGESWISTIWLGLNHNWSLGPDSTPIIFETMVFGGPCDTDMARYATEEQARAGHEQMVEAVRNA